MTTRKVKAKKLLGNQIHLSTFQFHRQHKKGFSIFSGGGGVFSGKKLDFEIEFGLEIEIESCTRTNLLHDDDDDDDGVSGHKNSSVKPPTSFIFLLVRGNHL